MVKTQICIYCGADQSVVKQQLKGYTGLVKEEAKFVSGGTALYHGIFKNCGTVHSCNHK